MNKIGFISALLVISTLIACQSGNKSKKETQKEVVSSSEVVSKPMVNMAVFFDSALQGNIEVVETAIADGVDIEARNENGYTALMLAGYNGHHHIIKLLLDKGAKVDAVDGLNRTALMFACTGPFKQAVEVLVNAGANVNAIDSHENWTPVMFAAGEGQLEVIKFLVANNADLSKVDIDSESALDFAQSKGHAETVKYLQSLMK